MTVAILQFPRDGFAFKGDWELWTPRSEAIRDRHGVVREAPSCYGLEHRRGVCPHGHRHQVEHHAGSNQVTDLLYKAVLDAFVAQTAAALGTAMVAAGTGAATRTAALTQLTAEYYRAAPTDRAKASATAGVTYFFFGETVANAYLHEWGIFIGAATATANSGTLAATWLYDFNKDSSQTINGQHTLSKA